MLVDSRLSAHGIQCYPPQVSLEDYCPTPTTRTQVTFPWYEQTLMLEKKSEDEKKKVDILHGRFSLKAVDFSMAGEKKIAHLGVTRLGAGPTRSSRDLTCPWLAPTHHGLAVSCRETRGPGHRRARASFVHPFLLPPSDMGRAGGNLERFSK